MIGINCGIISTAIVLLVNLFSETQAHVKIVEPEEKEQTVNEGSVVEIDCLHGISDSVQWSVNGLTIQDSTHDPLRFIISDHYDNDNDDDNNDHDNDHDDDDNNNNDDDDDDQTNEEDVEEDDDAGEEPASDHKISRLRIERIELKDQGQYKCSNEDLEKALFEPDTETDVIDIKVIKQVDVELTLRGPVDGTVEKGGSLSLTCTGDTTSDLVWYFNGALLNENEQGVTVTTVDTIGERSFRESFLIINEVNTRHQGQYQCRDELHSLDASTDIKVTEVTEVTEPSSQRVTIEGPVGGTVERGGSLSLNCKGATDSKLVWYLNGVLLTENGQGVTLTTLDKKGERGYRESFLTIDDVNTQHQGQYRCTDEAHGVEEPIEIRVTESDGGGVGGRLGAFTANACQLQITLTSLLSAAFLCVFLKT